MELTHCHGIPPKISFYCNSTRPGSNSNIISLPKNSTGRVCYRPVVLAAEKSSIPSNKIERGKLGASIALACALGVIGCCSNTKMLNYNRAFASTLPEIMTPIAEASPVPKALVNPVGDAVKSFFEVLEQLASQEVQHFKHKSHAKRLKRPSSADINLFKKEMLELIKLGKGDEAISQLQKECVYNKNHPESALNLEIALIEVYISQGKFKEALECNYLKDDHKSNLDQRIPLYKAIAHTMLAKQYWEELGENFGGFSNVNIQHSRNIPIN